MACDPFSILGRAAAIFQATFGGVVFPVKDRDDLVRKAGGVDRVIVVSGHDGAARPYSILDLLDAWPELDRFFPMESADAVAKQFARMEVRRKREHKRSPLTLIPTKHLSALARRPAPRPSDTSRPMPFVGIPPRSATGAAMLKALDHEDGKAMLRNLPPEFGSMLIKWVAFLHEYITEQERKAALAAALKAEQLANAADAAATTALDATKNVGASTTNEQGQQSGDQACAAAVQAATAAQGAADAAAEASAHAGAVPEDTQAQAASARAQTAAARAAAAASRAQGACERARDILSISVVTVYGHVTESDPCCDDDANGVTVEVVNVNYPEIPAAADQTDASGNYSVSGRFGHSSRVGCATIRVSASTGPNWGNLSLPPEQITVCTNSPTAVNFTFDAPGSE